MTVYIDADACPVVRIAEAVAERYGVATVLLCDTSHALTSAYSEVRKVSKGADAVDFALVNLCGGGDVVVTQDYGVAAMALSRGAKAIHQSGMIYDGKNIDWLLAQRHAAGKARRSRGKSHMKGPKKRTAEDDINFENAFEGLLREELK